mmetsp:Transcript_12754/g.19127  ORF Transcript_12754/g.19127 Transcript_12754/m.19127 type:complete len:86 (-) Transcript_12754:145-402(-)
MVISRIRQSHSSVRPQSAAETLKDHVLFSFVGFAMVPEPQPLSTSSLDHPRLGLRRTGADTPPQAKKHFSLRMCDACCLLPCVPY